MVSLTVVVTLGSCHSLHLRVRVKDTAMAPHLNVAGKARILALLEAGKSVKEVMNSVGVSRRTVQRLRSRFNTQTEEKKRNFEKYCQKTVKHPDYVMVWGCFSMRGRGGMWFLPKNEKMRGPRYTEVIREHLVPFMKSHGTKVFMQDGAPCHRVRPVKDIIRDNGWTMIDWPGNSPDLNPIENLRNFMKDKLEELYLTRLYLYQAAGSD